MITRWTRARASAALCALFLAVYPTSNWLATRRTGVGSIYFGWERHIPFVPLLMVPYLSIDLMFMAAPFLARSARELRTLCIRLGTGIVISGLFFVFFPLKFAFARPPAAGLLGKAFVLFRGIDPPFNQFPSLHIVIWTILLDLYLRHARGLWRWAVAIWFVLIVLSTVMTYQHHAIDVLGGWAVGICIVHFVGDRPLREPFSRSPRIGPYYLCGAALLGGIALAGWPIGALLLWPALSLLIVAMGYLFIGPGIYRKQDGAVAWTTWWLLWPMLLGQRLSLAHYARRSAPYDALTDRVLIGRRLGPREARELGVCCVIDLTSELPETRRLRAGDYLQIPMLDLTGPTARQIDLAVAHIEEKTRSGRVYVHCKAGYSRTAVIAGAYLLASGRAATVEQAADMLRCARPAMVIRPEAMRALRAFAARRLTLSSAGAARSPRA